MVSREANVVNVTSTEWTPVSKISSANAVIVTDLGVSQSFWSNCSSVVLAYTTVEVRQYHPRPSSGLLVQSASTLQVSSKLWVPKGAPLPLTQWPEKVEMATATGEPTEPATSAMGLVASDTSSVSEPPSSMDRELPAANETVTAAVSTSKMFSTNDFDSMVLGDVTIVYSGAEPAAVRAVTVAASGVSLAPSSIRSATAMNVMVTPVFQSAAVKMTVASPSVPTTTRSGVTPATASDTIVNCVPGLTVTVTGAVGCVDNMSVAVPSEPSAMDAAESAVNRTSAVSSSVTVTDTLSNEASVMPL